MGRFATLFFMFKGLHSAFEICENGTDRELNRVRAVLCPRFFEEETLEGNLNVRLILGSTLPAPRFFIKMSL